MRTASRSVVVSLILAPLALMIAGAGAANAVGYQKETFQAYEEQLSSGQIKEATINKRLRSIRVTLKDGSHVLAKYKPHEEGHVRDQLKAKHVKVTVLSTTQGTAQASEAKKHVHHKLRYIAGGIVIAVIVIVGGVVLYNRRRRE